jgi:hypothetical protein
MTMPGRKFNAGTQYRYGFQKQEIDDEIWNGAISYLYRVEDPRIGRFFATDPLEKDYPHNSPYAFSENRVLDGIELEGAEWKPIYGANDKEHKKDPIRYEWTGKKGKGTVESAILTKDNFTYIYSSATSKSGRITGTLSILWKRLSEVSESTREVADKDFLFELTEWGKTGPIKVSVFDSWTRQMIGSGEFSMGRSHCGMIWVSDPERVVSDNAVFFAGRSVFGLNNYIAERFRKSGQVDSDGLGPVDWILGGEIKAGFQLTRGTLGAVSKVGFRPVNFGNFKFGFNYAAGHGLSGRTIFHFENKNFIKRLDYHNLPFSNKPIPQKFLHYHYSNLKLPKGTPNNSAGRHLQIGTGINITDATQLRYSPLGGIWY